MPRRPRLVVIGSVNVDLTTFTDAFPRPGETIFGREFHLGFGGKGANQAVAAARCGAEVVMIARVGDDLFGPASIDNLQGAGVDTSNVLLTKNTSTGVAPIFVDSAGQNRILVVKGANDLLTSADIDAAANAIEGADFLIVQLEIPLPTVYYALQLAHRLGVKTILNPAPACTLDFDQLRSSVDYLIPNETEAEILTGTQVTTIESAEAAALTLAGNGMDGVVVTLGDKGCLHARAGKLTRVEPFRVKALDSTGAGDAFIGSLACFLSEGHQPAAALARANVYAALSTLSIGTQSSFVTRERFDSEWSRHSAASSSAT